MKMVLITTAALTFSLFFLVIFNRPTSISQKMTEEPIASIEETDSMAVLEASPTTDDQQWVDASDVVSEELDVVEPAQANETTDDDY